MEHSNMEISHDGAQRGPLCFFARRVLSNHFWITILSILICLLAGRASQAQTRVKNVLFVFSIVKYSDEMLKVMQPYMRDHYPGSINFYYAYLEDIQSEENPSWESQAEIYRRKYAGVKMDVVIANVGPSLRFALKYREKIFPGVPIVFVSVSKRELEGQKIGPGVTGVTNPLGFRETIDLALRLHPDTKTIATIAGLTNWDSYWLQVLHSELVRYQDKVKEVDLVGNPNRQMLERISSLPPHTLVMFQMAPQFSDQPDFGTWDLLSEVAQRFPTYSVWPRFCVNGCVGGVFKDPVQEWKLTAGLALRVLSGERADDIPIVHNSDLRAVVDWRELQRWHIPESALPSGSIVRFREPTLWERGRKYFIGGTTLIASLGFLSIYLLFERKRLNAARKEQMRLTGMLVDAQEQERIRAASELHELQVIEEGLRESEERMRLAVEAADFGIWIRDLGRNEIWATEKWRAIFAFEPEERLDLDTILQRIHPDDRDTVRSVLTQAIQGDGIYDVSFRLVLPTGELRWIASHGRTEFDSAGKPKIVRGLSLDITERKQADEEKQLLQQEIAHAGRVSLMGQLASALAHEINQPLGAILRNAEAAELFLQNPSPDLDEIREIVADIRKDDQRAGDVIDRMRGLLERHDLAKRSLDVRELISNAMTLVQFEASARQIRLEVVIKDDLPPIRGDAVHLQQVLLNLLTNGMDALDETKHENPQIRVTASLDGQQTIEIAVSDTGDGIPYDKFAHIFDPFFTTKANGMGMGLSISSTIIEAHNGQLWAENNKDGGASFRFTLPIADQDVTQ
jgi:PAS domain S-box-containing protein